LAGTEGSPAEKAGSELSVPQKKDPSNRSDGDSGFRFRERDREGSNPSPPPGTELDALLRLDRRVALGHTPLSSTAQRTASTTLANSAKKPSPVFLTIRPRCSAIFGLTNSPFKSEWARSNLNEWATSLGIRRRFPGLTRGKHQQSGYGQRGTLRPRQSLHSPQLAAEHHQTVYFSININAFALTEDGGPIGC
jgi:hypothetical protein